MTVAARHIVRPLARGLLAVGLAAVALLVSEGVLASRRSYLEGDSAPVVDGTYPAATEATGRPALRLVVLGDSTGAGVGVHRTEATLGAQAATRLAAAAGRPVELTSVAVSGSRAGDLGPQVGRALAAGRPEVALVMIGANDAVHLTGLGDVRSSLAAALRRLDAAGVAVVLATCPDLGTVRSFTRPLRDVAAFAGRRVAAAQRRAARDAGLDQDHVVDLAARTGPAFRADPRLLSEDLFHPSAAGYALWADAVAPALARVAAAVPVG